MRKAVAADHDCDQTCDLCDRSREYGLQGREAGVKGRAGSLGVRPLPARAGEAGRSLSSLAMPGSVSAMRAKASCDVPPLL